MVNSMEDRYDISVDIGEGKDYSVATLFENGEYRPIEVIDIRLHEIIYRLCGLNAEWERMSEALDRTTRSWEEFCRLCERIQYRKRRKTTYKTIRRDCAKRNRHK